ncbi:MAG: serine protease, partial [Clostridiales bacterium]|nr:serine protease [Clostridiales bacterium]
ELNTDKGYTSSHNLNYLKGKQGIAITDLRPSGTADFEGMNYDVISEGRYIVKGAKLKVVKVQGSKIIVKQEK